MIMNIEMILVGMILLSAMLGGGIFLFFKRRRESLDNLSKNQNDSN